MKFHRVLLGIAPKTFEAIYVNFAFRKAFATKITLVKFYFTCQKIAGILSCAGNRTFTNMAYDILRVLAGKKPVVPIAEFEDAYVTQRVLEAVLLTAKEKRTVKLKEIK